MKNSIQYFILSIHFKALRMIATFAVALTFMGCTRTAKPLPRIKKDAHKILVVHVLDYSKSTEAVTYFDADAAANLFTSMSHTGGTVKLIGAYENSSLQNVSTVPVPALDTASTESISNIYQRSRARAKNTKAAEHFSKELEQSMATYQHEADKPHTGMFTDLENAFGLARIALTAPNYSTGYTKYLLICSDMLNDPKAKRHQQLSPIQLTGVTVLIVRPAPQYTQEKLQALFPRSPVYLFTDVNEAIAAIH